MKTNLDLKNRKFSLKTILAIVGIAILLTSFASYLAFSNPVSPTISLDDLPSQAYFTIKTDGTNYWAVRYDGYKAYEGTVAHTVINSALGALTAGRTWKEKVALRGSFFITGQITPSSYTVLDLTEARLYTADETLKMIYILGSSPSNAKIHIDIIGGHLYGAGTFGSTSGKAIYAEYVNSTRIEGVTAQNFNGIGTSGNFGGTFWIGRGYHNIVHGCRLINNRGSNTISFFDQSYSIMSENFIDGGANKATVGVPQGGDGIYCGDTSTATAGEGNQIINNVITNWGGYDAAHGVGHAIYVCVLTRDVMVEGNEVYQPFPSPVVASQAVTLKGRGITFSNNHIHDLRGISHGLTVCPEIATVGTADDIIIENNVFRNITGKYSFAFIEGGLTPINRTRVFNNKFLDFYVGIQFACTVAGVSRYARIEYNDFANGTYGINFDTNNAEDTLIAYNSFASVSTIFPSGIGGTRTLVKENIGYKTEASSMATLLKNGDTITHGLVATPIWATVTCLNATYDSKPLTVYLDYSGFTSSVIKVSVYWLNGTAITNDVIAAYWEARTWNYP